VAVISDDVILEWRPFLVAGRSLAAVLKNPFRQKGPTAGDFRYTAFVE